MSLKISVDKLVEEYRIARPQSEILHDRAVRVFAADGATARSRILNPYRPYITRAEGSKKWDVDGNEYIDYVMGYGCLLLGHSHPKVVKAIQMQAEKGLVYGDNHELELEWAELIQGMMPSAERVDFFSSGTEANMLAIRLARVFTGRRKILRFVENFHGWADEIWVNPNAPGIVADNVTLVPYELDRVEKELATNEYAVLLAEGGGAHMTGWIPVDFDFMRALPDLAHKYGTVFHLDEIVTGVREASGGYQSLVGIRPDLTSLGKIISGGLGCGALVGRADIMDNMNPRVPAERLVLHAGTWMGHPLVAAAGIAALKLCQHGEPQKKAIDMAAYLKEEANKVFQEKGIDAWFFGRSSIVHPYFGPFDFVPTDNTMPPTKDPKRIIAAAAPEIALRLGHHLLHRGIATQFYGMFYFVLSSAHTKEDVDKTVSALADSLDAMLEEGSIGKKQSG